MNEARVTGQAFTVAYEPAGTERGDVGDFLDDVPAGSVVVIDNAGRTDCTVWGGIMTQIALARGVAGTVVHGVCRDVGVSLAVGYPVFSAGRFMRTGKDRVRLAAVAVPLTIASVTVVPGDLVHGDADGVDPSGGHSTATLYEAAGVDCAWQPGLRPVWPGVRVSGPAFTVAGIGGDNLALHRAVAHAPAGHVLVADLHGGVHGHWGEVLTIAAQERGLLGLVIGGGVRDVARLAALHFPVFASSVAVFRTGKDHPGRLGGPITLRGVRVGTHDLVTADADGVVVLPAAQAAATVRRADRCSRHEQRIVAELRAGQTTLRRYGLTRGGEPCHDAAHGDRC
jgi:4-hydroxy-4-methyl-2-oxoglutarate aldolase